MSGYTYRDSNHPHAVTTTSNGYTAAYDATGNMICRATASTATCNGSSPSGQQLSYDAEGRLTNWQNQPTLAGQTVNYLYDGSGKRVAMQSTVSGATTLTSSIGSLEEVQTSGNTTQTTTFYTVGGKRVAANVNGTFYYFGYDALGSQVAVLDASGNLAGAQLYGPYGSSRYHTGTVPTSIGFTGQRADSVTGLDYYGARYYDPVVGQFLSVDNEQGNIQGMDPYAYVGGNPESRTDPTGNFSEGPNGERVYRQPNGNSVESKPDGTVKVIGHTQKPVVTDNASGNPKFVKKIVTSTKSHNSGCDLKCRGTKAAAALHTHDTKETAANSLKSDGTTLFADIISILADVSNTFALVIDIVSSLIPHLLHLVGDVITYNGGTLPPLLLSFMAVGDALVGVANVIKSFAFFAFAISGVVSRLASFAGQSLRNVMMSVISSAGSATGSFVSMSQDVINLQDYNIDNVWTPQQIIDHCEASQLSCG